MDIEQQFPLTSAEESILEKDWAAGSAKISEWTEYVIDDQAAGHFRKVQYAPAWLKIIDEPIVNAIDHAINTCAVTEIKIEFRPDGRVRIYNDGPGIPIKLHKDASAKFSRDIYLPTFIFGFLFQGSNRNRGPDCITGGTNGLGAKISNCFSTEFIVETVDGAHYFAQTWRNHKEIEESPKIYPISHIKDKVRSAQHTTINFMPDYTVFGYPAFTQEIYNNLIDIVRTRVFFAASYVKFATNNKTQVYFNNKRLDISTEKLATICFPGCPIVKTIIVPTSGPKSHYRYPWELCAIITAAPISQLSNVNGIVVRDGRHINKIINYLVDQIKAKIEQMISEKGIKFSPSFVTNNICIFANTQIPNPSWDGQRKDKMVTDPRKFNGYIPDQKFTTQLIALVREKVMTSLFEKTTISVKKHVSDITYEKYRGADKAGKKDSQKCGLIMVEGDSAMSQVETAISNQLGWTYFGLVSSGGVIINARRKCTVSFGAGGRRVIAQKPKLAKNVFWNALMQICGLHPEYYYNPTSPTYKSEMAELRYGYIIACVDQDLDGKGNILGLLLSNFEVLFPNLLNAGYIRWFSTPICRLYPKSGGKVIPFYDIEAFRQWAAEHDMSKYDKPSYCKGIGTNSRPETLHMFKSFHEQIHVYTLDDRAAKTFEIYYGDRPDARKIELSKVTRALSLIEKSQISSTRRIPCSTHVEIECNLYQKDNLDRKLDHVADGQNQAGRKILDGILKTLTGTKKMRVEQLAGFVSEHENYHHGGASLEDSITGKAFVATGGKQLPVLVPLSMFGTRKEGGGDAASPRYINARLNRHIVNLIFPQIDYHILPFNYDEGKRSEPTYFAPIIPMVILESTEIPAHGWKLELWARDVFDAIGNVRRLIEMGDSVPLLKMAPCTYSGGPYKWKGSLRTIRGAPYSFGKYEYDSTNNIIIITELPLRTWTNPYVKMLRNKQQKDLCIIKKISDKGEDMNVHITIKLKPGAIDILDTFADGVFADGVEEYFQLRVKMDSHINLMSFNQTVVSFKNYEDVLYPWFSMRKEFYIQRVQRQIILLELNISYLENVIRYIEESTQLNLPKMKLAEMINSLAARKYVKFYVKRLKNPKFTPTADLKTLILGELADYSYLLDLTDRKKSEESLRANTKELDDLRAELAELIRRESLGRFLGAKMWMIELDQLEKMIREGVKTGWLYGDADKYEFD